MNNSKDNSGISEKSTIAQITSAIVAVQSDYVAIGKKEEILAYYQSMVATMVSDSVSVPDIDHDRLFSGLLTSNDVRANERQLIKRHTGVYLLSESKNHVLLAIVRTNKNDYDVAIENGRSATVTIQRHDKSGFKTLRLGSGIMYGDFMPIRLMAKNKDHAYTQDEINGLLVALRTHNVWQAKNLETGYNAHLVQRIGNKIKAFTRIMRDVDYSTYADNATALALEAMD